MMGDIRDKVYGADPEDTQKIKKLKRRVYDLYVNYKGVYEKAS